MHEDPCPLTLPQIFMLEFEPMPDYLRDMFAGVESEDAVSTETFIDDDPERGIVVILDPAPTTLLQVHDTEGRSWGWEITPNGQISERQIP